MDQLQYIYSQDELALYAGKGGGRVINADEALRIFGRKKIDEVREYGSAVLVSDYGSLAETIKKQREKLGITAEELAEISGLSVDAIERLENSNVKNPVRIVENVARNLGLDTTNISAMKPNGQLAGRLKIFSDKKDLVSRSGILQLADTAWVIRKQNDLQILLKGGAPLKWAAFEKDGDYGNPTSPAWDRGQYLARKTRDILGINADAPIESMTRLCEDVLEIPVIFSNLDNGNIAAVAISNAGSRGIVINSSIGKSCIRRISLAHELEHLLYDEDSKLNTLRMDSLQSIDGERSGIGHYVEQRARAFAAEFMAPQAAIKKLALRENVQPSDISVIMYHFGISNKPARFQYWNSQDRRCAFSDVAAWKVDPDKEWDHAEPMPDADCPCPGIPQNRRGRFFNIVLEANHRGYISNDTAASCLCISNEEYAKLN